MHHQTNHTNMTKEMNKVGKAFEVDFSVKVKLVDPLCEQNKKERSVTSAGINQTKLSFDPMVRSSSISNNNSRDIPASCESEIITKPSKRIQDDECDIRNDISPNNETELPDVNDDKLSPDEFLQKLLLATCGIELVPKKAQSLDKFFATVTDEQVLAYTMTVVSACRRNDLDALKKLYTEENQTMNCSNRFGESLLTMACRRGFEAIVEYLLQLPDVDIRVCDDSGRTVLHDACWNPSPQLKIVELIMERDPALFFISDNRGFTPFQYARSQHFLIWRTFLLKNMDYLQALKSEDVIAKLSKDS
ncbi:MAG: ankyrin repeat protein [Bacillariaceae sp.]|jgi:ankyrin repeat protein